MFVWLFIVITPLPVIFIPPRGAYALYIPSFGIAVFLAAMIARGREAFARLAAGPLTGSARRLLQMDTFVLCVILLIFIARAHPLPDVSAEDVMIRSVATQILRTLPKLNDSARSVLFMDDPFPADSDALTYIVRLHYRRQDLIVDRVKTMTPPPDKNGIAGYDYVFGFHGPDLFRVKPHA